MPRRHDTEKRILLAIQSAQNILARRVEPEVDLDEKATIVLDDTEVVQVVQDLAPAESMIDGKAAAILQDPHDSEINFTIARSGTRVLG